MTTWTDLSAAFAYGTKLTSTQMQQLRDNITALSEGASGAPSILYAAIGNDQIGSQHYVAGSIDAEHYAPGSVDAAAIGTGAVGQSEIAGLAVGQAELKTSEGSVSTTVSIQTALPGGPYGFREQIAMQQTDGQTAYRAGLLPNDGSSYGGWTSYATSIYLAGAGASHNIYARQYYVTASGEIHWIFLLVDKITGARIASWQAPDHPCFGNRGLSHPFLSYDPAKHEILVINPGLDDVHDIILECIPVDDGGYMAPEKIQAGMAENFLRGEKDFFDAFMENYEILESEQAIWPDTAITVGLPRIYNGEVVNDWRFMPRFYRDGHPVKISPVKAAITRPEYVTPIKYRRKTAPKP
jgi:hypothetical protein